VLIQQGPFFSLELSLKTQYYPSIHRPIIFYFADGTVPLGKLPLGSMWKAAGTLIVEQGADKLGVFDWFHNQFLS
jgi:hypothetical protein